MSFNQYQIEIDKVNKKQWDYLLTQFNDASIYQTWSMGTVLGAKILSHITIKVNKIVLGCCQVRLKKFPYLSNFGIADIVWGPLCIRKKYSFNPKILVCLLREIKQEYALNRGYLLRIWPNVIGERKEIYKSIIESEGFKINQKDKPYRTFIIDITQSVDYLRKNLLQKWRNCLNKAEKNKIKIIEGNSNELYKIFLMLARDMIIRKNINIGVDYIQYQKIQEDLPENLKMIIMICEENGNPSSAVICSAMGNTGIYLLGATGNNDLKFNSSYLLQWHMLQHLKERGFLYYDLGGFNPHTNPGVYHFKRGFAGKNGVDEIFLGQYVGIFDWRNRISNIVSLKQLFTNKIETLRHLLK